MVYIQILYPVASMVGTSSQTQPLNAIDNEHRAIGPESCGIIKPPNVVSISYGQDEPTATFAYATRQCTEYAKVRYILDQLFLLVSYSIARDVGDICDLQ
jgi:hypothetical protein